MYFQLVSIRRIKNKEFISLKVNQSLTRSDIEEYDLESELGTQIENLEMKDSEWKFCKIVTMTIYLYKTVELNGCSYGKIPLRSFAILIVENTDNYCFL